MWIVDATAHAITVSVDAAATDVADTAVIAQKHEHYSISYITSISSIISIISSSISSNQATSTLLKHRYPAA